MKQWLLAILGLAFLLGGVWYFVSFTSEYRYTPSLAYLLANHFYQMLAYIASLVLGAVMLAAAGGDR